MSSRIFSASLLLLVAGCDAPQDGVVANQVQANVADLPPVDPARLNCAVGSGAFAKACTFEREDVAGGAVLTVRHPDGGFRRLRIAPDGAITAADGAIPAVVSSEDGDTIVAIDRDRYRLPAGSVPSPAR